MKRCFVRGSQGPGSFLSFFFFLIRTFLFSYKQETMYHWEKTSLNPKRFKFDLKFRSHEHQEYSEAKWISPVLFLEIHRETAEDFSRTPSIFLKLVNILRGSIQIRNVIAFFFSFSHHLLLTHLSILFSCIKIRWSINITS